MTAWELMQKLMENDNPNAIVHFKVDMDADTISELAEDGAGLTAEPFSVSDIYFDDSDIDINLYY